MKTIAIANDKGGVGKTTTTHNLAAAFTRFGCRVLCVDLDSQGNLSAAMNLQPQGEELTMLELFMLMGDSKYYRRYYDGQTKKELVNGTIRRSDEGVYLLPSDRGLAVAETHLQGVFAKEFVLKRILELVQGFDLCLIDCQPQCNTITKNALVAVEGVLIPTQGKVFSVDGIGELEEAMEEVRVGNPTLAIDGILFNMTDHTKACKWHEDCTREQYGPLVLRTVIPARAEAEAAACERVSLVNRKGSQLGALWLDAARELLERWNMSEKKQEVG